ncbi:MAG: hypothetical protein QOF76_4312 [Solirubrobacteraceae bacterium]|jgi:hypothetical protein|nr:hypothetical protein [Solirubrobacteraceae bacterium]
MVRRALILCVALLVTGCGTGTAVTGSIRSRLHRPTCPSEIAAASWAREPGIGRRLTITPTKCGRVTAFARTDRGFAEAIAKGGKGAPNHDSIYRQFKCHALFATAKPEWHLEVRRPLVSWLAMVATRCNPSVSSG